MSIEGLSPTQKRALLAQKLRGAAHAPRAYPLSFGQQRLWFLDKFTPGQAVYSIPVATRLSGKLDVGALQHSLDTIVARHASLRTTFADQAGEPVQVVAPSGTCAFTTVERTDGGSDLDAAAQRFADEQARIGFDLERGPLFRAALATIAPDEYVLVLILHHIIADAWSLSVLITELSALYRERVTGVDAALPPLPLQYPDYAAWQRDQLEGESARRTLAFWTDHLAGAPELLTLPTDRPRARVQSYRGALHAVELPADFAAQLEAMARSCNGTLFMVLLAAYAALLGRLAGQDDVVVGTPVAGRGHTNLEPLIGFFVNTLPLRVSIAGDPTFAELVSRARDVTVGGLANAEMPFERLVEALQPERSLGHAPLFQAQLILQNAPGIDLDLPGLEAAGLLADPGVAKFDLTMSAEPDRDGSLDLAVEYNTDLFDAETARQLTGRLVAMLRAAAADPHRRLSELNPLTGIDRWQVVVGFNATERQLPAATTALDLVRFADGAAPAVLATDAELSYAELDAQSNRLAHLLRARGVAPEVPVALCLDRSARMVVALLAVWKAGGAFLPLDATWPADRLRLMLDDAAPPVLITESAVRQRLGELIDTFPGRTVSLDESAGEIAAQPAAGPPLSTVDGENLAYLIYTSGSTGRPKGVGVPHRAVVNLLSAFAELLDLAPTDRLAAVTTLSFDISILELLLPLVCGAQVLVVDAEQAADGRLLRRVLTERRANVMQATPATWRLLEAAGGVPPEVQVRLCGGEALPRDLADAIFGDDGNTLLWNVYGPTETTVWSAAGLVEPSPEQILIGPPIGNTQLYVLDRQLEPVPIGVVGELYIGGFGVARGYHGRPELTAERFLPDPFAPGPASSGPRNEATREDGATEGPGARASAASAASANTTAPGARMYATGDLVRWRRSGLLEFLGRSDHQVKVRGFRIELGEIEAVLRADELIADAVVTTWDGGGGDVRLVAYVVPAPESPAGFAAEGWPETRTRAQSRLPEYMVPAACVVLDALPLTPNGKVDRAALPPLQWGAVDAANRVAPRDAVEEALAAIWREVLGAADVGVHDDFFALGGHSLLAAKVLARVREVLGVDLPIRRFFEAPTVAAVAAVVVDIAAEPGQVWAIAELRREVAALSADQVRSALGE